MIYNEVKSFDNSLHVALTSVEKEDLSENSIIEIIQDGFKYGKEVIRYSKVVISRKPKPLESKPEPEDVEVEEIKTIDTPSEEGKKEKSNST